MIDKNALKKRIENEEDFIHCPRSFNSLGRFLQKHEDGVEAPAAAKVLLLTDDEFEEEYEAALSAIRAELENE